MNACPQIKNLHSSSFSPNSCSKIKGKQKESLKVDFGILCMHTYLTIAVHVAD